MTPDALALARRMVEANATAYVEPDGRALAGALCAIYSELRYARDKVFAAARKRMTELDGKLAELTPDELSLMHEMLESAMLHEMRSLHSSIEGTKKVDKYRALVERFFR